MTNRETAVADLTEGQLYDEANNLMLAKLHRRLSERERSRLDALENEFMARHTAALEAA